jgi:hypothetical protein
MDNSGRIVPFEIRSLDSVEEFVGSVNFDLGGNLCNLNPSGTTCLCNLNPLGTSPDFHLLSYGSWSGVGTRIINLSTFSTNPL